MTFHPIHQNQVGDFVVYSFTQETGLVIQATKTTITVRMDSDGRVKRGSKKLFRKAA